MRRLTSSLLLAIVATAIGSDVGHAVSRKLIKAVRCDLCHRLADQLTSATTDPAAGDERPRRRVETLLDVLEDACDPTTLFGTWIARTDIVGETGVMRLQEMPEVGVCGSECATLAKACQGIVREAGSAELVQYLQSALQTFANAEEVATTVCERMTSACSDGAQPLKKSRDDAPFKPLPIEEQYQLLRAAVHRNLKSGRMLPQAELNLMFASQPGAYEGRGSFGGSEHPVDEASAHGEEEFRKWKMNAYWWEVQVAEGLRAAKRLLSTVVSSLWSLAGTTKATSGVHAEGVAPEL